MNISLRRAALGVAVATSATLGAVASHAAVVYASSVDNYTKGAGVIAERAVTDDALGMQDGKFLSLGLGGSATFSFGMQFEAIGAVFEVTFGKVSRHVETADVYGIVGNISKLLGTISNASDGTFNFAGVYEQLKFLDTSPEGGGSRDGFDIDAINVTPAPIPLPAGGLLLLSALGAAAALRRRKV